MIDLQLRKPPTVRMNLGGKRSFNALFQKLIGPPASSSSFRMKDLEEIHDGHD